MSIFFIFRIKHGQFIEIELVSYGTQRESLNGNIRNKKRSLLGSTQALSLALDIELSFFREKFTRLPYILTFLSWHHNRKPGLKNFFSCFGTNL